MATSDSNSSTEANIEETLNNVLEENVLQTPPAIPWDPLSCRDWDAEKPTGQSILRIKRDIITIYKDPPPGMCIVPDKDDITKVHALLTGPFDTPYEGGFFYFLIRCPPDYPIHPPRVRLMTTGDGLVRFNPNLYKNGKVCLSILGCLGSARPNDFAGNGLAGPDPVFPIPDLKSLTWSGPAWSPAQSLASVLISIQSVLNEKPYHNEPGFERERNPGDVARYNEIIRHETLRVAVCDMLEHKCPCPEALYEVMQKSFSTYFDYYASICRSNQNLNGQTMQDPFGERRGTFDYQSVLTRLEALKASLCHEPPEASDPEDSSDSETEMSAS